MLEYTALLAELVLSVTYLREGDGNVANSVEHFKHGKSYTLCRFR